MNIKNSIFGNIDDLNSRRVRYRNLLAQSLKDERLLWLSEEEYDLILSGMDDANFALYSKGRDAWNSLNAERAYGVR